MRLILILAVLVGTQAATAASSFKRTLTEKKNRYVTNGVFVGGKASDGVSLLGVRKAFSAKANLERVIVDLGDRRAQPSGKNISYYQVSLDSSKKRVVLDLAQLTTSNISEAQLKQTFKKSPYVSSAELTLDPEDKAATMVLNLKRPMKLEVFELLAKGKPSRVVMDLTPIEVASAATGAGMKRLPASRKTDSKVR